MRWATSRETTIVIGHKWLKERSQVWIVMSDLNSLSLKGNIWISSLNSQYRNFLCTTISSVVWPESGIIGQ
jgi:hypothetical protein